MLFINFEGAFDYVSGGNVSCYENLWHSTKVICLVQAMYDGYTSQVKQRGKMSQPIAVGSRVARAEVLV